MSVSSHALAHLFRLFGYQPHPAQLRVHLSPAPRRLVICGRRFGKTTLAAVEAAVGLLAGARVWVVAPTYRQCGRTLAVAGKMLVRIPTLGESMAISRQPPRLSLWGGVIEGKSGENPAGLLGERVDLLILDEAARLSREVWESHLSPALIEGGRALIISTPYGRSWLHELFQRAKEWEEWEVFQFPSEANPLIPTGLIERERRRLPEDVFAREYLAEFVLPQERAVPEFDPEVHVGEVEFDPWLDLYRAIDFGFSDPFVCLDFQITPQGQVRVIGEYYRRMTVLSEHVRELRKGEKSYPFALPPGRDYYRSGGEAGERIHYAADPSGGGLLAELRLRLGRPIIARRVLRESSFMELRELFRLRIEGEPAILIHPRCENLIRELSELRLHPETGQSLGSDHAVDALRYGLAAFLPWREPVEMGWTGGGWPP